jgi:hypothetical protein
MNLWTRNISSKGWVGIDLDSCLAHYESGQWPEIGEPVPAMLALVKLLLSQGREVRIMTARVGHLYTLHATLDQFEDARTQEMKVQVWCRKHLGVVLPVTAVKDYDMACIFDDRAITVEKNTGRILTPDWISLT